MPRVLPRLKYLGNKPVVNSGSQIQCYNIRIASLPIIIILIVTILSSFNFVQTDDDD
jgi:hypothetical protein